jgi:hypothetical protein
MSNLTRAQKNKLVFKNAGKELTRLKGIFTNKLTCFTFVLLGIAYMGDYWSFNLAGAFLPIILLRNNVSSGQGTVQDTYRQYLIIYSPGIIGSVFALISVQMPLLGRKWSLVFSAICQGLSMAMYTQVKTTAGYVGLNALEYIMQTVRPPFSPQFGSSLRFDSTLTPFSTLRRPNSSILRTVAVLAVCFHVWVVLRVLWRLTQVHSSLLIRAPVFCGSVLVVFGSLPSLWSSCLWR